jgi:ectoine hydroxylase-related dioxygenase (phytanoyl-CoA dioxygenase family)
LEPPSFAVTLIIPFIDLNEVTGSTRLIGGSHLIPSKDAKNMPGLAPKVPVGSCFLMDYRLTHQGMANQSNQVRPILSIIYQQPWFRDYVNYSKQKPLIVAPNALDGAAPELRKMVKWIERE